MSRKQWFPVSLPLEAEATLLQRVVVTCANVVELRLGDASSGSPRLEVLCADEAEFARAEALIHQAVADQILRARIAKTSDQRVDDLVAELLRRAGGG
jgi:hypothetical protein